MKALIIDDEAAVREALAMTLRSLRLDSLQAGGADEGLRLLRENEDIGIIFLDVKMPGRDGMELLEVLKPSSGDAPVIMISGHGTIDTAVQAMKRGAFNFLEKPLDRERVLELARSAMERRREQREALRLKERVAASILGQSKAIRDLLAAIDRVAPTQARVLVTGENGTGKELVARRVHDLSPRSDGPFVDVNCAAIPKDLLESELFGHEKGSFTGAFAKKRGKFELAHGGTLFLDEVGDMDLAAQAKVLRVLEQGKVERVGGDHPIDVDVRVIAATNKNLPEEVAEGRFREDLYYRLNVVELRCPPLRERRDDVGLLAEAFLQESVRKNKLGARRLSPPAIETLGREDWPGNVRQLKNVIENLAILAPQEEITAEDVEISMGRVARPTGEDPYRGARTFDEFKDTAEKEFLERRLRENHWNVKRTAEILGMQRSNLYKKIEKYGLQKPKE